jgi:hypothetical protein
VELLQSCAKRNLNGLGFLQMKKLMFVQVSLQMMESMAIYEALKKVNKHIDTIKVPTFPTLKKMKTIM